MPSLKTIRKRIGSVKSTQKITRAMKMVAGARLARSQARITALRPYAVKTAEVLQEVARSMVQDAGREDAETPLHKLLERREEKKVLYVVISADRGLAGAFNANISKAVLRSWREKDAAGVETSFVTVGRKGREQVQRRGGKVLHDFTRVFESIDIEKARTIALWLTARYRRRDFDAIYLVFSEFKSAITQTARVEQLLPLPLPSEDDKKDAADATPGGAPTNATGNAKKDQDQAPTEYIFEPGRDQLLERLLPMYLEISILRGLYESQASFFGAQMTAMDAATRNAKDLIGRLTLVYNRARQAAITKELMEIIGGAEALKE
jgi:F-type H+-transporting ATPase subunit gamma